MSTGTLYDQGNRFTYLNTAGTTVISTLPTRLVRININDQDSGGLVDLYNGVTAAGEQVASLEAGTNASVGTKEYNVALSGGLTVVLTNNPDVTVIYR